MGEATLEVEIDVLFLSFSVSVKCRREFGGSEGDPNSSSSFPINRPGPNTARPSRRRPPDMATQSILWTALPNGYSEDGQSLRIFAIGLAAAYSGCRPASCEFSGFRRLARHAGKKPVRVGLRRQPHCQRCWERLPLAQHASTTGSDGRIRAYGRPYFHKIPS